MPQRSFHSEDKSLEALVNGYDEYRNRQRRMELLLVGVAGATLSFLFVGTLFLNRSFLHEAVEVVRSYEQSEGRALRTPESLCSNPQNQGTLFCKRRLERATTQWRGYNGFNSQNTTVFPLVSE